MRIVALAAILLTTSGCAARNEEIIRETNRCVQAGLEPEALRVDGYGPITSIQCAPKATGKR